MRSIAAIFIKQALDMIKNRALLPQYLIFPLVAFCTTELIAKAEEAIPDGMFVSLLAPIFTGMILMMTSAEIIAEDKERRSIRFLVMAGVKPYEYLLGIGCVVLIAAAVVSAMFGFIGGFTGEEFLKFMAIMMLGAAASMVCGAAIGMVSKNQQTAMVLCMPVAIVLGFSPMIAVFNETARDIFGMFYTLQMESVVSDFSSNLMEPFLVTLANIAVLLLLFTAAYKKKGLRE